MEVNLYCSEKGGQANQRNILQIIFYITGIFAAVLLLFSCSRSIDKTIVGKWIEEGKPGYFEFLADQSIVVDDGQTKAVGKWIAVDKNRIKAEFTQMGRQSVLFFDDITIRGDTMTMTFNGNKGDLRRKR